MEQSFKDCDTEVVHMLWDWEIVLHGYIMRLNISHLLVQIMVSIRFFKIIQ